MHERAVQDSWEQLLAWNPTHRGCSGQPLPPSALRLTLNEAGS